VVETVGCWSPPETDWLGVTGCRAYRIVRSRLPNTTLSSNCPVIYRAVPYSKFRFRNWSCRYLNYFGWIGFRWWKSNT